MRRLLVLALLSTSLITACKKKEKDGPKAGSAGPSTVADAGTAGATVVDAAEAPKQEVGVSTDSDVQPSATNLADFKFADGPPLLPKGFQIAVIEGTPPFTDPKSFAFLLKFPKDYVIPLHTHAVEERVTVLKGTLLLGEGDKVDKAKTKPLETGGIVAIPGGAPHWAIAKGETIIHVQGVGPFGITYPNPKDDPRQPPPPPEAKVDAPTDTSKAAPVVMNPKDVQYGAAPPILASGIQLGVVEGTPPFTDPKSYVFRLKMPDGAKIMPHHHNSTERVVVISGTLRFGSGDKWDDKTMTELKAGAAGHIPKGDKHYVQAKGETVVQIQGVGPFDLHYADPNDDPSKAGGAGSAGSAGSAAGSATK